LYAVWVVSQTATSYVLDVGVQVTSGYTGNKTDYINALAIIPDNSSSFTSATLTGKPAGVWGLQSGLTAGGCKGDVKPYICAGATGMGTNLFTNTAGTYTPRPLPLIYQFTITGKPPSLGDTAYIKFNYINSLGTSVGGSGSFNLSIQCIGGNGCTAADPLAPGSVPEPVTSALIGGGLVGLYFMRRRLPGSR
jgi:hypothetical protein